MSSGHGGRYIQWCSSSAIPSDGDRDASRGVRNVDHRRVGTVVVDADEQRRRRLSSCLSCPRRTLWARQDDSSNSGRPTSQHKRGTGSAPRGPAANERRRESGVTRVRGRNWGCPWSGRTNTDQQ